MQIPAEGWECSTMFLKVSASLHQSVKLVSGLWEDVKSGSSSDVELDT